MSASSSTTSPPNTLVLHRYVPAFGLPDISPFCIKVDTYLKLAGISYSSILADGRKAPKGKLPVINDGGRLVADSSAIIDHLEATRSNPLDRGLSVQERALSTALRSMMEEHFYFILVYQRWTEDHNWQLYRPVFHDLFMQMKVPRLLAPVLLNAARKGMRKQLFDQGTGRHTPDEVVAKGKEILDAVNVLMGEPFCCGATVRSIDATLYAFLVSLLRAPFDGPLKQYALHMPKLSAYCEAIDRKIAAQSA